MSGSTEEPGEDTGESGRGHGEPRWRYGRSRRPIDPDLVETPEADPTIPAKEDKIIFQFNNKTDGAYADSEIYWCILGYDPSNNKLCYVDAQGNLIPATAELNTVKKNDRMCADICNTLSENKYVYMPSIVSGRMYISYGSQVYITINEDSNEMLDLQDRTEQSKRSERGCAL